MDAEKEDKEDKEERFKSIIGEGRQSGKKIDITLFMLRQAIQGVYFNPQNKVLLVVFKNEDKALEFINKDPKRGPEYFFSVHGRKGISPFFDKFRRRVAAYAQIKGKVVILTDEGKASYERFNGIPNPQKLEIFQNEYGQAEKLPIKDIKEMEEQLA